MNQRFVLLSVRIAGVPLIVTSGMYLSDPPSQPMITRTLLVSDMQLSSSGELPT